MTTDRAPRGVTKMASTLSSSDISKGMEEQMVGSRRRDCSQCVGDKVAYLSNDHQGHASPPVGVLEISISLARLFLVFDVRFQQTDLLQHERDANKHS